MQQFASGTVSKQYLCVVDGVRDAKPPTSFVVDAPIQRAAVSFLREVGDNEDAESKHAFTTFEVMDEQTSANMSLLKAVPRTGRTHQIRVHAAHCGLPIIGDDLYNPKEFVYLTKTLYLNFPHIVSSCDLFVLTYFLTSVSFFKPCRSFLSFLLLIVCFAFEGVVCMTRMKTFHELGVTRRCKNMATTIRYEKA